MGKVVSLVLAGRGRAGIADSIRRSLDLIGFGKDTQADVVVIKPNLCYYWDAYTGYTTDPRVVMGVIDLIREEYRDAAIKVVEADATAMKTEYAFKILGYERLAKENDFELLNLSQDATEEVKVRVNSRDIAFKVPRILLESDIFINIPKLKIMRETHITCAMKNVFGCIASPRKIVYHEYLNEAIVGINKILRPDLNVVDGLVALSRFPVRLGLIMAGEDPFSVDWVSSQIMGYNPRRIGFLKLAMNEDLWSSAGIETRGDDKGVYRDMLSKTNPTVGKWSWNLQLQLLRLYRRIAGDVLPPILEGT